MRPEGRDGIVRATAGQASEQEEEGDGEASA